MSVGLSVIVLIIIGSLLACAGFEFEWAIAQISNNAGLARGLILFIGWAIIFTFVAIASKSCRKLNSHTQGQLLVFAAVYTVTAVLTPRSYTFDTGLYHLPVITHLSELGLENNLGWLHSRYGFFNLLLYGQAMASRVTGLSNLPTLNSIIIASTLTCTYEYLGKRRSVSALACSLIVAGAILIPSESTESYHSYNADFALGCIFLVCIIGVLNWNKEEVSDKLMLLILIAGLPLIKLSGLLLLPLLVVPLYLKRGPVQVKLSSRIRLLLSGYVLASVLVFCSFGYISTGYLAYPVAHTGPLRSDALQKETAINDSSLSMVAWARYAYSDQLAEIKADSIISDWFPRWSKSLNGKRMLTYLTSTAVILLIASLQRREASYVAMIGLLFLFWGCAILVLPPDPRFYWGPILATLWFGTDVVIMRINSFSLMRSLNTRNLSLIAFTSWTCMSVFTYLWRESEYTIGEYPAKDAYKIHLESRKPYVVPRGRQLIKSHEGACWNNKPPCIP